MWPPFAERLARAGVHRRLAQPERQRRGRYGTASSFPSASATTPFPPSSKTCGRVMAALYRGRARVAPPTALGLVGHSRGGGISILHAASDARVRALVTWAAISTVERWHSSSAERGAPPASARSTTPAPGEVLPLYTDVLDDIEQNAAALDIQAAAERITVPWLLVHGSEDEAVSVAEGKALAAAAPPSTRAFLTVEGAGHTFGAAHPWHGEQPGARSRVRRDARVPLGGATGR